MLNRLFTKKERGAGGKEKKKNEENCSEFLDSLVGTIMHTIFQKKKKKNNNKGYDIKLFFFLFLTTRTPLQIIVIIIFIKNTRVSIFNCFDE